MQSAELTSRLQVCAVHFDEDIKENIEFETVT